MNILILTRYPALGASSRLRSFQFVPSLERAGFRVKISPLFDDDYLLSLYGSKSWIFHRALNIGAIVTDYARRMGQLLSSFRPDVVWVEKELFPYLPALFESLLARRRIPYVVDYDDAVFHNYDLHRSSIVRHALGRKLDPLLRSSFAVTAGNKYLADYAKCHGATRVEMVPTVVDVSRYPNCVHGESKGSVLRVGWIGSPSTSHYLGVAAKALERLSHSRKILLVLVGAKEQCMPGVAVQEHAWRLDSEAALIGGFDVGIMPLHDSPWESGKCGYKLIQYMACGKPVVASPVGVNPDIVTPDVGFLASSEEDWVAQLSRLADEPGLRAAMGAAGRRKVEEHYSLQAMAPKVVDILAAAAGGAR